MVVVRSGSGGVSGGGSLRLAFALHILIELFRTDNQISTDQLPEKSREHSRSVSPTGTFQCRKGMKLQRTRVFSRIYIRHDAHEPSVWTARFV